MSDTVGMSFHVPRHIHKAFKIACMMRDVRMSRAITMLMERYAEDAENVLKQMVEEKQLPPTTHTPPT